MVDAVVAEAVSTANEVVAEAASTVDEVVSEALSTAHPVQTCVLPVLSPRSLSAVLREDRSSRNTFLPFALPPAGSVGMSSGGSSCRDANEREGDPSQAQPVTSSPGIAAADEEWRQLASSKARVQAELRMFHASKARIQEEIDHLKGQVQLLLAERTRLIQEVEIYS